MKTLFTKLLLIGFANLLLAQSDTLRLQQLQQKLEQTASWETVQAAEELGDIYKVKSSCDTANFYYRKIIHTGKLLSNDTIEAQGYIDLAHTHRHCTGQLDSAVFYCEQVINRQKEKPGSVGAMDSEAYYLLGAIYLYNLFEIEKAYEYFQKNMQRAAELKHVSLYSKSAFGIANIYYHAAKDDDLINLVNHTIKTARSFKPILSKEDETRILHLEYMKACTYAMTSDDNEKRKEAATIAKKQLIADLKSKSNDSMIGTIADMINFFVPEIPQDTLLFYAEKGFIEVQNNANLQNGLEFLSAYGQLLNKAGKYKEAVPVFEAAQKHLEHEKRNFQMAKDIYGGLKEVHRALGETEKAFTFYDKYSEATDSLFEWERKNVVEEIETRYKRENQEAENAFLKSENEWVRTRANLSAFIGFLLLVLLGVGIYFYWRLRSNKKYLEKINASKNQLFTILAHDLKGPAYTFHNLSNKISFLIKKGDNKRMLDLAENFEKNGSRVSQIINSLLDWAISQKESIEMNPEQIIVKPEMDELIKELESLWLSKNIVIENKIPQETAYQFDFNSFKIVMRNLLTNAIKYSPSHSRIIIENDSQKDTVKVKDFGIGMPSAIIQDVLNEIPVKSQEGTAHEVGSGIGLSTCVKLVRKNGANILIDSKINEGTTVMLKMKN